MINRHEDTLAILVKNIGVDLHHHHAVQLVISLDKPYKAVLDNQEFESIRGFLIDSDVPHACQSANATVLVISVDATSTKGGLLKQQLSKNKFLLIDKVFSVCEIDRFSASYWNYCHNATAEFDPLHLICSLYDRQSNIISFDQRSLAAIAFINQNIGKTIQVTDIARHVDLSEGRLRHLFSEQIGIPITSYILWARIKVALKEMLNPGVTLANAAHRANFSDHAHFTRTFRRMFGISPSLLLKHSQFLQVFDL
ncbi:helix-turn-helix transcriptional regulator [Nodosilinea nodulosa]|uniref:helix-turn-helix transcriptional regulator n=1 Tax=Nodosilinea nodulosa TaxID=416001 RepID=UPI00036ACEF7|nr:AraC family transcriptional regulator [Nodosilinea nodulosa]